MKNALRGLVIIAAGLWIFGCESSSRSKVNSNRVDKFSTESSLYVMGYNVHNLFDIEHTVEGGEDKNDYQFLPGTPEEKSALCENVSQSRRRGCLNTDWTAEKLAKKLETIYSVVNHSDRTPDILGVSEIENKNVADMMAATLGYQKFEITTSPDKRGIDVAVFYNHFKLDMIENIEHEMNPRSYDGKATRNTLLTHFKVRGSSAKEIIAVSVNHWPSQGNDDLHRVQVARQVRQLVEVYRTKYEAQGYSYKTIMLGDFNVIESDGDVEGMHAIRDELQHPRYEYVLNDVETMFNNKFPKNGNPLGTYYFANNKEWNALDRIFVSDNLMKSKGLTLKLQSFDIVAKDFMMQKIRVVKRTPRVNEDGTIEPLRWRWKFAGVCTAEDLEAIEKGTPEAIEMELECVDSPWYFKHGNDVNEMGVSDHFPVEATFAY